MQYITSTTLVKTCSKGTGCNNLHGTSSVNAEVEDFREIQLTRGYVALVSLADYERVSAFKWSAMPVKSGGVYARRSLWVDGKCTTVLLHRFIANVAADVLVDHRDGNGLDCRRHNIRFADYSQNGFNKRRGHRGNTGLVGVSSQTPGRFRACVAAYGRRHYTATYSSSIEAAAARDVLAAKLHGEFAVFNFPLAGATA